MDYVAEPCRLSKHCNYAVTLPDMLCYRLVCGITDQQMHQQLFAEKELTFAKALEFVQALEAAEQDVQSLIKSSPRDIYATQPEHRCQVSCSKHRSPKPSSPASLPPTDSPCTHCGGQHWGNTCRFKTAIGHSCQKRGHICRVCRSQCTKQSQV